MQREIVLPGKRRKAFPGLAADEFGGTFPAGRLWRSSPEVCVSGQDLKKPGIETRLAAYLGVFQNLMNRAINQSSIRNR